MRLASGWLARQFPGVDFLGRHSGHLLEGNFGWRSNPYFGPFHLLDGLHWRRLLAAVGSVARTRRGAGEWHSGRGRTLRAAAPSAVRRIHSDHDGISVAVADADHLDDVRDHGCGLRTSCTPRRAQVCSTLWCSMGVLRTAHAGFLAALGRCFKGRSSGLERRGPSMTPAANPALGAPGVVVAGGRGSDCGGRIDLSVQLRRLPWCGWSRRAARRSRSDCHERFIGVR